MYEHIIVHKIYENKAFRQQLWKIIEHPDKTWGVRPKNFELDLGTPKILDDDGPDGRLWYWQKNKQGRDHGCFYRINWDPEQDSYFNTMRIGRCKEGKYYGKIIEINSEGEIQELMFDEKLAYPPEEPKPIP